MTEPSEKLFAPCFPTNVREANQQGFPSSNQSKEVRPVKQLIEQLRVSDVGDIYPNEPLAPHTTWKIGGPCDVLVVPKGKRELAETIRIAAAHKAPWTTIGRGSNLLVSDKGISGIVIKLGKAFDYVRFEDTLVIAGGEY
jgi:UDP-N-acetylmuramate dehydrogenase